VTRGRPSVRAQRRRRAVVAVWQRSAHSASLNIALAAPTQSARLYSGAAISDERWAAWRANAAAWRTVKQRLRSHSKIHGVKQRCKKPSQNVVIGSNAACEARLRLPLSYAAKQRNARRTRAPDRPRQICRRHALGPQFKPPSGTFPPSFLIQTANSAHRQLPPGLKSVKYPANRLSLRSHRCRCWTAAVSVRVGTYQACAVARTGPASPSGAPTGSRATKTACPHCGHPT
jgi:hypothetical protein